MMNRLQPARCYGNFDIRFWMMMLVSGHDQAPAEPLNVQDCHVVLTRAAPSRAVPAPGALRNARVE
jgi:hypothetical protein